MRHREGAGPCSPREPATTEATGTHRHSAGTGITRQPERSSTPARNGRPDAPRRVDDPSCGLLACPTVSPTHLRRSPFGRDGNVGGNTRPHLTGARRVARKAEAGAALFELPHMVRQILVYTVVLFCPDLGVLN